MASWKNILEVEMISNHLENAYGDDINEVDNPTNGYRQVCRSLRTERKRQNLSQVDFSIRADVSQNMTYIETGKRICSIITLLRLCDGLGISPAVLFDGQEKRSRAKEGIIRLARLL